MYVSSNLSSKGFLVLGLTLVSIIGLGLSSPGLTAGEASRGVVGKGISTAAPPAAEARSKTTGRRKPREIVVVGSGASARPTAPGTAARPLAPRAPGTPSLPHDEILTGDMGVAPKAPSGRGVPHITALPEGGVAAPKAPGTRSLPHDEILTGDMGVAPKAPSGRGVPHIPALPEGGVAAPKAPGTRSLPHDEILTGDMGVAPKGGAGGIVLRDRPRAPRVPFFSQLGQTLVAEVPMQPVSCGPNCTQWKLAIAQGKLGIEAKVGMSCPAGAAVTYLAYQPNDSQNTTVVFQGPPGGNTKSLWKTVVARPFTAARLEQACDEALQQYPLGQAPVVEKLIKTKVNARGQCSDSITTYERQYPVTLRLRCVPPPPVG